MVRFDRIIHENQFKTVSNLFVTQFLARTEIDRQGVYSKSGSIQCPNPTGDDESGQS